MIREVATLEPPPAEDVAADEDAPGPSPSPAAATLPAGTAVAEPAARTLRRDLRAIAADGAAFSVMVGAGETYLPAFALAMGLGEITAGLVASVPMLSGAVLQLVSPAAVRLLGSLKRWVVCCAAIQAASFLPLLAATALGTISTSTLFLAATLYWAAGLATGPAWNTWVSALVPTRVRARFFAFRTRLAHLAVLAGLVGGGLVLQLTSDLEMVCVGFAVLFGISLMARAISATVLAQQSEPATVERTVRHVGARELVRRFRHRADARLLAYLVAVQLAVQVSGPYFSPYMLGQLDFSYGAYMGLLATSYVAKILVLPAVGHLTARFGARRLLWIGGLGIIPLSALWLFSSSFVYLLAVQVVAGSVWAVYELATMLLVFESIEESERTSILTTFNLCNAVAIVGGAMLGGAILHLAGPGGYDLLFGGSMILRVLTIALLVPLARLPLARATLATRTLAVRPQMGTVDRPILASIEEKPR